METGLQAIKLFYIFFFNLLNFQDSFRKKLNTRELFTPALQVFEEDTRMSADLNRGFTPGRYVFIKHYFFKKNLKIFKIPANLTSGIMTSHKVRCRVVCRIQ